MQMHCQVSKMHCHQSENHPFSFKPWNVNVRFLWVTALFLKAISWNQKEHRDGKQSLWKPDLRIRMTISLPCCFWQCSLIIRNKLTWKHTQLVSLSTPLSIQTALLSLSPTITPSFPAPPPRQPLCPLVSGHLAWQSIILTAPRERKRGRQRDRKTGVTLTFRHGPHFFLSPCFLSFPSSLPTSSYFLPLSLLFNPFVLFFSTLLFDVYF